MDEQPLVERLRPFDATIFTEITALAVRHRAVNLGQGAPGTPGPDEVLEAAVDAIRAGRNQYAPGWGVRPLREAIAAHQQRHHGLEYDPASEVVVTAGATEAITAAVLALCEPGDEVVALSPAYDSYAAACALAHARLVEVPLSPPAWRLDPERLRAAVTDRTRLLLVNTPHNPTGRVLDPDERAAVAAVAREHDLVVVTDEVYEHLWFDGHVHVPLAALPGMRERTLVVSSGGKTFSVTGWKVGWACGPRPLVHAVHAAKQWLSFSNATPQQYAVATGLDLPDTWFDGYRADHAQRRATMLDALDAHGLEATAPEGTYFVALDARQLGPAAARIAAGAADGPTDGPTAGAQAAAGDTADLDGLALCRALPAAHGVAAVPLQVFGSDPALRPWLRLAFCKPHDEIREGVARLAAVRDAA